MTRGNQAKAPGPAQHQISSSPEHRQKSAQGQAGKRGAVQGKGAVGVLERGSKSEAINSPRQAVARPCTPPTTISGGRQAGVVSSVVEAPESWEELRARALRYLEEWEEVGEAVPSVSGLARWLGVSRRRLLEWRGSDAGMSEVLDLLDTEQRWALINRGLTGEISTRMAERMYQGHVRRTELQDMLGGDKDMVWRIEVVGADGSRAVGVGYKEAHKDCEPES